MNVTRIERFRDLGAAIHMHYFDVPLDELWRRLEVLGTLSVDMAWYRYQESCSTNPGSSSEPPDETELSLFDRYFVHTS